MKALIRINHFIHDHLLKLLLLMNAIIVFCPGPGIAIKNLNFGRIQWTTSPRSLIVAKES